MLGRTYASGFEADEIVFLNLDFRRILNYDQALVIANECGQRIQQGCFAGAGAPGDQYVPPALRRLLRPRRRGGPGSSAASWWDTLLVLVNVWDAVTARLVAELPGCRALATASHSIAEAHGYRDGEQIPRDLMIEAVGRIAAAVELPVSADLEAGYGDVGETVRRAIAVGAVGANIEDRMRPLPGAAAMMACQLGPGG